jgi:hypothetical protein
VFISHDDIPRTATGKVKLTDLAGLIASRLAAQPAQDDEVSESAAG